MLNERDQCLVRERQARTLFYTVMVGGPAMCAPYTITLPGYVLMIVLPTILIGVKLAFTREIDADRALVREKWLRVIVCVYVVILQFIVTILALFYEEPSALLASLFITFAIPLCICTPYMIVQSAVVLSSIANTCLFWRMFPYWGPVYLAFNILTFVLSHHVNDLCFKSRKTVTALCLVLQDLILQLNNTENLQAEPDPGSDGTPSDGAYDGLALGAIDEQVRGVQRLCAFRRLRSHH